jgi:hypothetical protein
LKSDPETMKAGRFARNFGHWVIAAVCGVAESAAFE